MKELFEPVADVLGKIMEATNPDFAEALKEFMASEAEIANLDLDLSLTPRTAPAASIRELERKLLSLAKEGYEVEGTLKRKGKRRIKSFSIVLKPQIKKEAEGVRPCVSVVVVYYYDYSSEISAMKLCGPKVLGELGGLLGEEG